MHLKTSFKETMLEKNYAFLSCLSASQKQLVDQRKAKFCTRRTIMSQQGCCYGLTLSKVSSNVMPVSLCMFRDDTAH